jgi:hypothetical protein
VCNFCWPLRGIKYVKYIEIVPVLQASGRRYVHTLLITENSDMCAVKITIFHFCQTFLDRGIVLAGAFQDIMDKTIAWREPTVC